jgi:ACS family tartrate transporter-like MFS transporter
LVREQPTLSDDRPHAILGGLTNPLILVLAIAYTGVNLQLNTAAFWLPQIFRSLRLSNWEVAACTAIPFLTGAAAMYLWGKHLDQSGERILHVVGAVVLSSLGWAGAALATWVSLIVVSLSIAAIGFFSATVVFWTLPPRLLRGESAAGGIALISATGGLGSAVAAPIVGSPA